MNKSKELNPNIKEEFELREKRLNLVYKILYVLSALWAAILISYIQNPGATAPLYCCVLAILTTAIINILSFVFGELKCLRIVLDADQKAKNVADRRFLGIWDTFGFSVFVSLVLLWSEICFPYIASETTLLLSLSISISVDLVLNNFNLVNSKTKFIIHSIVFPVSGYSFFALIQVLS